MLPRGNFYQGPRHPNVQTIDLAALASGEAVALEALASAVANATPEMQRIVRAVSGIDFNKLGLSCNFVIPTLL